MMKQAGSKISQYLDFIWQLKHINISQWEIGSGNPDSQSKAGIVVQRQQR